MTGSRHHVEFHTNSQKYTQDSNIAGLEEAHQHLQKIHYYNTNRKRYKHLKPVPKGI